MARISAAFDRWWNGVSLRAKVTGVTVLLLTFGLTVAGAGTMTVLRSYLVERLDTAIAEKYAELPRILTLDFINRFDEVDAGRNPYYLAAVSADGQLLEDNLPRSQSGQRPEVEQLTDDFVDRLDGSLILANEERSVEWRLLPAGLRVDAGGARATLLIGLSLAETDALIARYTLIYFLFALAVVLFGAAATQLLVTSTFTPLRDVEATAARFASGDYSQRLGGATPNTEVGRLNRSLNTMLARIDRAFADRDRAMTQMRRFIGDASHELRTPLVSVRGYAELYRMGALTEPEDIAQAMDRIEREAIRMGGLVEDLLVLARLDEATPPRLAPVDLIPIAQDAALDLAASSPQRQVRVVVVEAPDEVETEADGPSGALPGERRTIWRSGTARPARGGRPAREPATATGSIGLALSRLGRRRKPRPLPAEAPRLLPAVAVRVPGGPVVLAEENKLRQVVTNLLGNALRFTPDDSPIEIEVAVDRQGGYGQISVVDHGEGVPPQLRERIFERFWRADTSRTRETGGSGLGLAIVAGIVASHRGHVEVLETPGGGATFRVSIPLAPSPAGSEPSTADGEQRGAAPDAA